MSNTTKKYVSPSKLSVFLDNIIARFSQIGHKHTISDISDYKVDTELSSTSTNPVQNKVIDAEFDAIATALDILEQAIDDKLDTTTASSTYETKTNAQTKYDEAKSYTDDAVLDKLSMDTDRVVIMNGSFTNQIPISIDVTGKVYNTTGFKTNTRWSSSGKTETATEGHCITGYIPAKYNDVLRLKNVVVTCTYPYIVYFNSNKQVLGTVTIASNTDKNGIDTYTLNGYTNTAFIRLVLGEISANSIATINQDLLSGGISVGWLIDTNGNMASPNVFSSQVMNEDGTFYTETIDLKIEEAKSYTDTVNLTKADSTHTHPEYTTKNYVDSNFALKSEVSDIDLSNYYTKTEVDSLELITPADIDAICGTTIQVATVSEVTF